MSFRSAPLLVCHRRLCTIFKMSELLSCLILEEIEEEKFLLTADKTDRGIHMNISCTRQDQMNDFYMVDWLNRTNNQSFIKCLQSVHSWWT